MILKMKRVLSLSLLLVTFFICTAQDIHVKSLELLPMDLTARINSRKDINGETCALLKVQILLDDVVFEGNVVGDVEHNVNEYNVYMTSGSKSLIVRHAKYHTLTINFSEHGTSALESRNTYSLLLAPEIIQERIVVVDTIRVPIPPVMDEAATPNVKPQAVEPVPSSIEEATTLPAVEQKPVMKEDSFGLYIGGAYQPLSSSGIYASLGAFIGHFNVEASALIGLSETEEVFAYGSEASQASYSYKYKSMGYGVKLGYAIPCGKSFRITPQIGAGIASISGTQVKKGTGNDPDATSAYAVPAAISARLDYLISNNFGINLTPEFCFAASKSDLYTRLSEVSSDVKGLAEGFNARVGIFVCF